MQKFLGIHKKKGKFSHNVLSPLHKLLYNIARRFILPRNSKCSEANLRDATLIYYLANHIKINFPSLMISHLSDCIEKKYLVGYGGLLTWIFSKFGVPLKGLHFLMGPNNKIGAKCLNNLHLKLNDNGILENANEQVNVDSDKEEEAHKNEEKEEEVPEKEDQESIPSATEKAEGCSIREQGEVPSKGEAVREGEDVEEDNDENDVSDEEVLLPVQKQPITTPRKSRRLASKGKRPIVVLDDDSTSHNTVEPTYDKPPSPKPTTPPAHQIPSPLPSPIPSSPPLVTTHTSPNHGFDHTSVPTTPLFSILLKLNDLQSQFFAFQDKICVSLASITDQITQMEARLGAEFDIVEVQIEYVEEEETAP